MWAGIERHVESEGGQPSPSRRAQGELSDEYFANCQRARKNAIVQALKQNGENVFIPRVDQEECAWVNFRVFMRMWVLALNFFAAPQNRQGSLFRS
jgi:hypothetical protein